SPPGRGRRFLSQYPRGHGGTLFYGPAEGVTVSSKQNCGGGQPGDHRACRAERACSIATGTSTPQKVYGRFGVRNLRSMTKEEIDQHLQRETAERDATKACGDPYGAGRAGVIPATQGHVWRGARARTIRMVFPCTSAL